MTVDRHLTVAYSAETPDTGKAAKMESVSALKKQVGGNHYKVLLIQPVELCYANSYDPCIFSVMKYIIRHHLKNGAQDLQKAAHFCFLRAEMIARHGVSIAPDPKIDIGRAILVNQTPDEEAVILRMLDKWSRLPDGHDHEETAAEIAAKTKALSELRYP